MKNINVLLAKKYINSFYEVLSMSIDEKTLKEIRKNVEKYEDVLYIKQVMSNEIKENIKKRFVEHRENNIARYESMIEKLDKFYQDYFTKEITDVKAIDKQLVVMEKEMINITDNEYLEDIHALFELRNNINVELKTYEDKHKNDEYLDMALFDQSITGIIKEAKDALKVLIDCNKIDENEYVDKYIDYVYQQLVLPFFLLGFLHF